MSNTAIEFENIGKLYQLGRIGTGTLSHDINRWWHTRVLHLFAHRSSQRARAERQFTHRVGTA
jgi:hypothetical protein